MQVVQKKLSTCTCILKKFPANVVYFLVCMEIWKGGGGRKHNYILKSGGGGGMAPLAPLVPPPMVHKTSCFQPDGSD